MVINEQAVKFNKRVLSKLKKQGFKPARLEGGESEFFTTKAGAERKIKKFKSILKRRGFTKFKLKTAKIKSIEGKRSGKPAFVVARSIKFKQKR